MKFNSLYFGITLIILSFIGTLYSIYYFVFTIPIFILGCIIIIFSKIKIIYKILIILLPLLLFSSVNSLKLELYSHLTRKEFIISKNYSGPVRIVYEQKCGQNNTDNKTYNIPGDGILILSARDDGGLNHHYFYLDENGEKIKIPETEPINSRKPIPSILSLGYGYTDLTDIKYYDFYIYNGDSIRYNYFGNNATLDSITRKSLIRCRKK